MTHLLIDCLELLCGAAAVTGLTWLGLAMLGGDE